MIGSAEIVVISNPQPVEQSFNRIQSAARQAGQTIRRALDIPTQRIRARIDVNTTDATRAVDQFTRDANGRLRDARGRFVTTSQQIGQDIGDGIGGGSDRARGSLSRLVSTAGSAASTLGSVASTGAKPAAAGLLAVAGSAGAATVATAGLAVGVAGLGAGLLATTDDVQAAFKQLGTSLKAVGVAAAEPLKGPLLAALRDIEAQVTALGPDLTRLFSASVPALETLTDGVIGLVRNALPGITTAVGRAGPVLDSLTRGLESLGTAVSETFDALSSDPEATAQALDGLFTVVTELLPAIGQLAVISLQVGGPALRALGAVAEAVSFVVDQLSGAITTVVSVLRGDFDAAINQLATNGAALTGTTLGQTEATNGFTEALAGATTALTLEAGATATATAATGVYANAVAATNSILVQQKADADSLRQGIFALSEAHRTATDAQSIYEDAVDSAAGAIKANGAVLDFQNGKLDLNSARARDVYDALSLVAGSTKDYSAKTLEATGSTTAANKVFREGEKRFKALARQAGLSADEADRLARELLGIPPIVESKVRVTYERVGAGPAQNKPLPPLANGAIVRRATAALVGEAGDEVIIPLTRPRRALQLAEQSGLFNVLDSALTSSVATAASPLAGTTAPGTLASIVKGPVRPGGPRGSLGLPTGTIPRGGPAILPPFGSDPFRREGPVPVFNLFIGGQRIDEIVEAKVAASNAAEARAMRQGTRR